MESILIPYIYKLIQFRDVDKLYKNKLNNEYIGNIIKREKEVLKLGNLYIYIYILHIVIYKYIIYHYI